MASRIPAWFAAIVLLLLGGLVLVTPVFGGSGPVRCGELVMRPHQVCHLVAGGDLRQLRSYADQRRAQRAEPGALRKTIGAAVLLAGGALAAALLLPRPAPGGRHRLRTAPPHR
ncbi:hypothetical protein ACL03H_00635 [Saccharopolyspora sp. MS10]|uniref:hypothetical protein n=1 Tax=Saccharopolyspora sp. MS10 TaxID=3385973 RepID=UPI00399FA698